MSLKVLTRPLMSQNGILPGRLHGFAAATLNRERDEDGPPLACSLSVTVKPHQERDDSIMHIGFVSVADGVGGSGKRRVRSVLEGQWQERTMAYIASRKAQEAARNLLETQPEVLTRSIEEIRKSFHSSLQNSFSTIKFRKSWFGPKRDHLEDFPTTFSAAVIQETNKRKRVLLFWAGDSPLFVFSPDRIMTTHQPDRDLSYAGECLRLGGYRLEVRQLEFSSDTPLLVVAASDGIVKFKDLFLTNYFILESVQKNAPKLVGSALKSAYQKHKRLGHVIPDDTTIAMVSSMKPGEISALSVFAPTQFIS